MQVAPTIVHRHHSVDTPMTPPSSQEKPIDDSSPCSIDVSQHLISLKTRLDFACFKLHHGWENSTLIDVESMWKKKQRQMYSEIPTPRVTQQDILDKRSQVPSARTNKAKRARLTRTMSAPSPPPAHHTYKKRKSHHHQQQPLLLSLPHHHPSSSSSQPQPHHYQPSSSPQFHPLSSPSPPQQHHGLASPPSFSSRPIEIRPRLIQPQIPRDPYRFYHHPHDKEHLSQEDSTVEKEDDELEEDEEEEGTMLLQKRQSMDIEVEEDDDAESLQGMDMGNTRTKQQRGMEQPKSSLDFLSYAIAMKEGEDHHHGESGTSASASQPLPDVSPMEPNVMDNEQQEQQQRQEGSSQERTTLLRRPDWDCRTQKKPASAFHSVTNDDRFSGGETDSDEPSPPSSPVAAAAHAIMMFVHDHYSRNNKSPVYHNNKNNKNNNN
ncbi:hypothetical protein BDA99DRAFT_562373 [Phascolomyces articulosus]|uniref:Uncharacterized protein n=1 Tax=Phascolomyces articulosus TaxID=60185 RepID=A0AAD5JUH0_9FUNG|nr:hypothetical protein BDA99DRAFT_562373 [Phascolomyces articulosus]